MNRIDSNRKSNLFRMKWVFMSPKERYAYLWSKTRKLKDSYYYQTQGTAANHNN